MNKLLSYLAFIPAIKTLVLDAESLFPIPQNGQIKLEYVNLSLQAAAEAVQGVKDFSVNPSELISFALKYIPILVAFLNKTGVFKKA